MIEFSTMFSRCAVIVAMPFMLSCKYGFVDVSESHVRNDRQLLLYPDGHGGANQLWRVDSHGHVISMLNENVCLGIPSTTDVIEADLDVVIQHVPTNDEEDTGNDKTLRFEIFDEQDDSLHLRLRDRRELQLGFDESRRVIKLVQFDASKPIAWSLIPKSFEYCRPATSCSLFWLTRPSGLSVCRQWRLKCRLVVHESADHTYYCAIGFFPGGYAGIQRISEQHRVAIFSLWNADDGQVEELDRGEDVEVSAFDSEGTGLKSMKRVEWKENEEVTLVVEARLLKEELDDDRVQWQCSCWYTLSASDPCLMASFARRSKEPPLLENGFYSFIEDWNRVANAEGHRIKRSAVFDKASIVVDEGDERELRVCQLTKVQVGHDKFACDKVQAEPRCSGVFLATGGELLDDGDSQEVHTEDIELNCSRRRVGSNGAIISCT